MLSQPLHCLKTKSNNKTRGEFECNVTWFCFCFDFVRSHARCGCCSIVCRIEWGKGSRSRGWKIFESRWTGGAGVLENYTIFMDVTCVPSLKTLQFLVGSRTLIHMKIYSFVITRIKRS